MEKAKRARRAETPKQPSLCLRLRAPYLYPDPERNSTVQCNRERPPSILKELDSPKVSPRWLGGLVRQCPVAPENFALEARVCPDTSSPSERAQFSSLMIGDAGNQVCR